jgi:hypothetical protein
MQAVVRRGKLKARERARARRSRPFQALVYHRVFVFSFLPALIVQLAARTERMRRPATAKMSLLA